MNGNTLKKNLVLLIELIIFLTLLHCSPRQYPDSHFAACYPNHPYDTVSYQWTEPADSVIRALSKRYTNYSLMVANSAGLLNPIHEYEREKKKLQTDPGVSQRIKILEKKEIIINRISLFRSQVASVAAELDCEGERADQLSAYLDKIDRRQTKNLTVASIVTGAIGGVAAALLNGNDSKGAAVTGGIGSGLLGLLSLSSTRKINLKHPRNLLHDVWFAPTHSKDYPVMVWNMLSHPMFSNSQQFSVAYYMRKRWEDFEGLKPTKKKMEKKVKLLLSQGGEYTAGELKLRANMINQMQATVKLIDQDIQGLLSEIGQEK